MGGTVCIITMATPAHLVKDIVKSVEGSLKILEADLVKIKEEAEKAAEARDKEQVYAKLVESCNKALKFVMDHDRDPEISTSTELAEAFERLKDNILPKAFKLTSAHYDGEVRKMMEVMQEDEKKLDNGTIKNFRLAIYQALRGANEYYMYGKEHQDPLAQSAAYKAKVRLTDAQKGIIEIVEAVRKLKGIKWESAKEK